MIHAALFLLSLGGFVLLFLATGRHQQDWFGHRLPASLSRRLRRLGVLLLALAFVVAGDRLGWGHGTVAWCGWLTAAASLTVLVNTNRDRIARSFAFRRARP